MRRIVLLALASCIAEVTPPPDPPTCEEAMIHLYYWGCEFPGATLDQAIAACERFRGSIEGNSCALETEQELRECYAYSFGIELRCSYCDPLTDRLQVCLGR